jgi:hypothetical protein
MACWRFANDGCEHRHPIGRKLRRPKWSAGRPVGTSSAAKMIV